MHWREHIGSQLLGAYSLYDDTTDDFTEKEGLIINVIKDDYVLGGSGKQKISVANTSLGKPLKLISTIAKEIAKIAGTKNVDRWKNVPVIFYVDKHVKFGNEYVEAIRVKPRVVKKDYTEQITKLKSCKTLAEMQTVYMSFSVDEKAATQSVKDELKTKLK